ncbi:MAG: hypothetical protein HN348_08050 [Proteobacteria bacterium]|nr:hypothetical protein [Pseudomonadota bacterium]
MELAETPGICKQFGFVVLYWVTLEGGAGLLTVTNTRGDALKDLSAVLPRVPLGGC